jgi:hypothetical protein
MDMMNAGLMYVEKIPLWRRVRIPPPHLCESKKGTKMEPGTWVYNGTTLSLGPVQFGGLDARLTTLLCKKIIVAKFKRSENRMI